MDQEADGRPTVSNRFRPWTHLCLRPGPHVAAHGPQGAACLPGASARPWPVNLCVRVGIWAWGGSDRCFLDQNVQHLNIILHVQN